MTSRLRFALLLLLAAAPLRAEDAPAPAAAPTAVILDGPASVSVGAEAVFNIPAGWRFVPATQLKSYFGADGRKAGAWDRGIALDAQGRELRLLFEPCGLIDVGTGLDSGSLLERAQAAVKAAAPEGARELLRWNEDPHWDGDAVQLRLSAVWREGEAEALAYQLRWLGRQGVLKLDWRGSSEQAAGLADSIELLQQGWQWNAGQAHPGPQPGALYAKRSLDELALDAVLGRTLPVAEAKAATPLWALIAACLAGLLALGLGLYKALMGLIAWLEARAKLQADAARLDKLEKDYGGRAADVEEIEEEGV